MTERLDDEIARLLRTLLEADDSLMIKLSGDERAAIATSKRAAARGEFATDAQVKATWTKHGL